MQSPQRQWDAPKYTLYKRQKIASYSRTVDQRRPDNYPFHVGFRCNLNETFFCFPLRLSIRIAIAGQIVRKTRPSVCCLAIYLKGTQVNEPLHAALRRSQRKTLGATHIHLPKL